MRIRCLIDPSTKPDPRPNESIWLSDVLRMSSSVVTALNNGCIRIYIVEQIEEALRLSRKVNPPLLSIGERYAEKLDGFDMNNSPTQLSKMDLSGLEMVMTTTNGARRIQECQGKAPVGIFSLLNLSATARYIAEQGRDQIFVSAGRRGLPSVEDNFSLGALIGHLRLLVEDISLDKVSIECLALWEDHKAEIPKVLKSSDSGRHLFLLGFEDDLNFCSQLNVYDLVTGLQHSNDVVFVFRLA